MTLMHRVDVRTFKDIRNKINILLVENMYFLGDYAIIWLLLLILDIIKHPDSCKTVKRTSGDDVSIHWNICFIE